MAQAVLGIVVAMAGLAVAAPVFAQDIGLSEVRGGIFSHSVDEPGDFLGTFDMQRVQDLNVELLFDVPAMSDWLVWGELRPHLGSTVNFGGLESMVYGGLSWTVPVFNTPLFLEASFGGAIHNGNTDQTAVYPARSLGCTVLFRESLSVGTQITENASIMATIEHASNANLCNDNRGLTNMGLRVGWKF